MKKTLTVLGFALCATFAFAQTQTHSANKMQNDVVAANANAQLAQNEGYKGSIFTKTDAIDTWEFTAAEAAANHFTTGTVGSGAQIGGQVAMAHGQSNYFSQWRRISGVDQATIESEVTLANYPYHGDLDSIFRARYGVGYFEDRMDTANTSGENGFMFMAMIDNLPSYGGSGSVGVYNAYIALEPVSTTGSAVVDVRFYQYYTKYYEYCYLDYSTDGTTWNTMEINVTGVDMQVNDNLMGFYSYTLPLAAGNQSSLSVRFRYFSDQSRGNADGYWWMIDDAQIIPGDNSRWVTRDEYYIAGGYQIMPQGLELPLTWYTSVTNNGAVAQTGVNATTYHLDADMTATAVTSVSQADLAAGATADMVIDHTGYYDENTEYPGWVGNADNYENPASLPTTTAGVNYFTTTLTSTTSAGALSSPFDTIPYLVNVDDDGNRVWGLDNGILNRYSYSTFGATDDGYVTDDCETYGEPGYTNMLRFKTGKTVPEGWVIRGVQLVASAAEGEFGAMCEPYAQIMPQLWYSSYSEDGESVSFPSINTGADVYEITIDDLNVTEDVVQSDNYGQFQRFGEYNVINIEFPEQPDLEADQAYWVGYQMVNQGLFCVASQATYYTFDSVENGETVTYRRNFAADQNYGLHFYGNQVGIPCGYESYYIDAAHDENGFSGYYIDAIPMIRMIVGPRVDRPTTTVAVECEFRNAGEGIVYSPNGVEICGLTDTITVGARATYQFEYMAGSTLESLIVDGVEQTLGEGNFEYEEYTTEDGTVMSYMTYTFYNISNEPHTIQAIFNEEGAGGGEEGFDALAAGVSVNLQPNPATSHVNMTIAGVSGMVDMQIIDMSGRVVMAQQINAEAAQNIDLSNIAKGAYFVRITNNDFSKVEKLIVR